MLWTPRTARRERLEQRAHPAPFLRIPAGPGSTPLGGGASPRTALTHFQAPSAATASIPRLGQLLALGRAAAASALAPCSGRSSLTAHASRPARRRTLSPGPEPVFKGFHPRRRRIHSLGAKPSQTLPSVSVKQQELM